MKTPKISVICTTYNRQKLLQRALDSVMAQTFKDYELVVIDDCSQDSTGLVVKSLYPKAIYYKNKRNLGPAGSRNKGFEISKGEYIVYLDDDNEFMPDFLKEAERALRLADKEVKGVRVGRIIHQNGFDDYATPITHTKFGSIDWGFLMKREVLDTISYDPNICGDEDTDFGIEFSKRFTHIPIDKPLTIAYGEDLGDSVCMPTPKRLKGLRYFLNKHKDLYATDKNEQRYIFRLAGRNFYKGGFKLEGIKYFFKSFLAMPQVKTFLHFFFILFGWRVYDWFMDKEERKDAKLRMEEINK